jgi:exopolyphosphatase/guanosine-5'-triphosphate,3'-diphosphate pyrophosphatase
MRIAAIDIGTNSLHMIVCRIRPDLSFEVVDREKDMIRLGTGGLDGRQLAEPSMSAALQTLSKFTRIAASHGVDEIIAAATSAVREAGNGPDFVAAVRRAVGLRVQVISGTEEARLIHRAAAYSSHIGKRTAVVVDIGGGSTEITVGTAERLRTGRSFKLGVIRLTERFVTTDPISDRDRRRLVRHVRRQVGPYLAQISKRRIDRVIGTFRDDPLTRRACRGQAAVRRLAESASQRQGTVTAHSPADVTLARERLQIADMDPRRADLAPAGAVAPRGDHRWPRH